MPQFNSQNQIYDTGTSYPQPTIIREPKSTAVVPIASQNIFTTTYTNNRTSNNNLRVICVQPSNPVAELYHDPHDIRLRTLQLVITEKFNSRRDPNSQLLDKIYVHPKTISLPPQLATSLSNLHQFVTQTDFQKYLKRKSYRRQDYQSVNWQGLIEKYDTKDLVHKLHL